MASLGGYHDDRYYDRFKQCIEKYSVFGHEAQGARARFAPFHILTKYWTTEQVREIVYDTGDLDYQIEDIRGQYLRIFSILVWISTTSQSYVRYLKHFMRNGRDDHVLPFRERPTFFPSAPDSESFWTHFFKNQWMFCPVELGLRKIHNRELHSSQILPFTGFSDLGSENIGRPAKIRLAKVHTSDPLAQTLSVNFPPIYRAIMDMFH